MKYLAFDTETTGLVNYRADPGAASQPDLVQLAAILYDENAEYCAINLIVRPTLPIPSAASDVHGISEEIASEFGVPRGVAVAMFNNLVRLADCIVAHNLNFDMRVMQTAYMRENKDIQALLKPARLCTMLDATPVMKLDNPKRPDRWKWPSLIEAYRYFVDPKGFEGAHDAMIDVRACIAVHRSMLESTREVA